MIPGWFVSSGNLTIYVLLGSKSFANSVSHGRSEISSEALIAVTSKSGGMLPVMAMVSVCIFSAARRSIFLVSAKYRSRSAIPSFLNDAPSCSPLSGHPPKLPDFHFQQKCV